MCTPASVAVLAVLAMVLSACGNPGSALVAATESPTATPSPSQSRTPTPSSKPISKTPCTSEAGQQIQAGTTFVCTADDSGKLVWLAAGEAKALLEKRAVAAAERVAAEKAAEKIATEKVAVEQAAAEQAAAQAAADQAAAEEAAAAEAQAAREAAAPPQAAAPPAASCDPNYSGPCVPIASDVDCAGGSGNGPAYVRGPVYVIGSDIYGLDGSDNDGIGCEK